ncbi:hypothetical protein [Dactylosporangium sp. CA-233914]|uniref:hypothetical protein n=1 Tax=Dactylosporangium sp. CA-233914 TaxID=3239934 RepID=UPI003D9226A4
MSAVLTKISRALGSARADGCAPDCSYEYLCDGNGIYYSRQCCYQPDCSYLCGSWFKIGRC